MLFPLDTLILFVTASALLALAPGPDNIFVLTQSMSKGSKPGIFVTMGLCTGLIVHTTAVALGVAAIFQTSQLAFDILKYIGAAYLLYLAYLSFKSGASHHFNANHSKMSYFKLYRRGIFMNITNPKVSIFFLAFLPQFTDIKNGSMTLQIFVLGFIFIICTFIVFSSISLVAGKLGHWFNRNKNAEGIMNKIAGGIFTLLALKLAFTNR
ncbi:LysE family translocator [Sulfurospirillum sp. 1612]|uniref:LysE family translocator n=1 Tax=Sulfurospirillum sp. 1612 TaxID=3094835 RepID=UPI002F92489C